ncbi:MAG: FKBP-type peptidyl-prolyl cis-trans isomerase [Planctomycetes bacterium]|nr:FKBP-type peptidyl-prolyl cis-trans isomerase [Planctomycetota bacterium]
MTLRIRRSLLVPTVILVLFALPAAAQGGGESHPFPEYKEEDLAKNDSGLRWKTLVPGEGDPLEAGDVAVVHYSGWLTDRTLFDSSLRRGETFRFQVGAGRVIAGWDEGLVGMKKGEKRLLVIPPALGYGDSGAGDDIPPGATLVFVTELVEFVAGPKYPEIDPAKVQRTASGLGYIDLAPGDGAPPPAGATVSVHYSGWLENGKLFDSSRVRDEPLEFQVGRGRVIKGWDEGLASMRAGGRRILIIPADLAYGSRGAGGVIPPGATLVFEVELLRIRE